VPRFYAFTGTYVLWYTNGKNPFPKREMQRSLRMDMFDKLKILTDAAKFDVACTSSG
jgi:hypothetical protein